MSDPTDPIDQAAQSVAKHAHDVMFQGIVNGLFGGGSDAALLQAVLDELRELNRAQRRVETEVERENRLLREENAALKRVLMGAAS